MAEIRCPMCGKSNPAGLEVCQHCQARLTPLRPPGSQPADAQSAPAAGHGSPREDLPDWLRALRPEGEDQKTSGSQEEERVDWLSSATGSGAGDQPDVKTDRPEGGLPDWLQGLRADSQSPAEQAAGEESGWEEADWQKPGWDQPAEEPFDAQPLEGGDFPDWLSHVRADIAGEAAPFEDEASAPFEPDSAPAGTEAEEVEGQEAGDEDVPDWLKSFHAIESGEGSVTFNEESYPPGEQYLPPEPLGKQSAGEELFPIPDWLEEQPESAQAPETLSGVPTHTEDEIPSLAAGDLSPEQFTRPEEEQPEAGLPTPGAEAFEAPGEGFWSLAGEDAAEVTSPAAGQETAEFSAGFSGESSTTDAFDLDQALESAPGTDADDLSWISDLRDEQGAGEQAEAGFEKAGGEGLIPGQEAEFTGQPLPEITDEEDTEDLGTIESSDLPAWLAGMRSAGEENTLDQPLETEEEQTPGQAAAEEDDLAKAELPNWLQGMRPVETGLAMAAVHEDEDVEGAGPLAGLASVLPAEPDISQVGKPAAPVYKLQVPELQQTQAELFRQLIASEGQARTVQKRRELPSNSLLRILIALVLAAAALAPLFMSGLESSPAGDTSGVSAAREIVSALPAGAPVLLSIDYEPGWAGEMDAAAAGLVGDIIGRGAALTLVSTSPTGPLQGEHLIGLAAAEGSAVENLVNLGYIPGGAAGLQAFTQSPRLAKPNAINNEDPWSQPGLQTVDSLADFSLVVVVTESPDDARAWIEQAQPALADTPLVMVVSAQAQPLLEPYFRATPQQVQGLVTGLSGGVQYERLTGQGDTAGAGWSAFSLALFAAVLIIFLGGLFNLGSAWLAGRRARGDEEG